MVNFSRVQPETDAQVAFLRLVLPGRPERNVGVFLLHQATGSLYFRLREDWDRVAEAEEAELLSQLSHDFRNRIQELGEKGGQAFLESLEDQLSNVLQLTGRTSLKVGDVRAAIDRLFEENCTSA